MPTRGFLETMASSGIDLLWLIFGFVGSVLGISYMPKMSAWQMVSALMAGLACAALGPQLAAHYYQSFFTNPIPPAINNTFAFLCGITGMFIIPGLLVMGAKFKDNPFWVLDWLRGRGQP